MQTEPGVEMTRGAKHAEHQEQPLSEQQAKHPLSAPIQGGRVEQARLGWECDPYRAAAGLAYRPSENACSHVGSPPSSPFTGNFWLQGGCGDMNVRVCKAKRLHIVWSSQASVVMGAGPYEPSGSLAVLQPGARAGPCQAALRSCLLWALEASHGCWEKGLAFFSLLSFFLIFSDKPTQFCNIAKRRLCPLFVLCPAEGRDRKSWVR